MSARAPYRAAAPPEPVAQPPRELTFRSSDLESHRGASRKLFTTMLAAAVPAIALSAIELPAAAMTTMLVAFAVGLWRWRTSADVLGIVLRVGEGELTVERQRGRERLLAVPLKSLDDVLLDTKSIQKLRRNTAPSSFGIGTSMDGAIDVSRVVLVPKEPDDLVPLTESHIAHTDAVELAGRVRRFLRANGWVPSDERPAK